MSFDKCNEFDLLSKKTESTDDRRELDENSGETTAVATPTEKMRALDRLAKNSRSLTQFDVPIICHLLSTEQDPTVKLHGAICLNSIVSDIVFRSSFLDESSLFSSIWGGFLGSRLDETKSAVVGACDASHQKDVPAILQIRGLLNEQTAPNTDFLTVPLAGWDLPIEQYLNMCFVGRDSFFEDCPLYPVQINYTMPRFRDGKKWFGVPLSPESKVRFHHVAVCRRGYMIKFIPLDKNGIRVDFGTVSRVRVQDGIESIPVVHISGATSLATVGAGEFATKYASHCALPINWNTEGDFEILLKVVAPIDPNMRPWKPRRPTVMMCSPNPEWDNESPVETPTGYPPFEPRSVILVIDEVDQVQEILIDGLPPELTPNDYRLLRTTFQVWRKSRGNVISLDSVTAASGCPERLQANLTRRQKITYLQDHLRRPLARIAGVQNNDGMVSVQDKEGEEIVLNLPLNQILEIKANEMPTNTDEEIRQQQEFEAELVGILNGEQSPQEILSRFGVIMLEDESRTPTIVRVSRC